MKFLTIFFIIVQLNGTHYIKDFTKMTNDTCFEAGDKILKEIATQYTDKKVTLYNADAILIAVYGFINQQEGNKNV